MVKRLTHPDTERFGLDRARNNAAVIVGQNYNRASGEFRLKHALAGDIEIIAVHESIKFGRGIEFEYHFILL
jgi:hypothetical protein